MKCISINELKEKEVINLCSGEKLGYPKDFDLDLDDCRILSMLVTKNCGFSLFDKSDEYYIPWCRIECIGEDAILVKLHEADKSDRGCSCHHGKKSKGI